ncbi:MAG: hypothetical protein H4O13_09800 [Xanthomonadales bacterium]|nr:hypothetical protein [Xanthomonadales bacterium]
MTEARTRDQLAVTVARNVQHMNRLAGLYRVASEPQTDPAALRQQITEAARALASHDLETLGGVEDLSRALPGLTRLVGTLRQITRGGT